MASVFTLNFQKLVVAILTFDRKHPLIFVKCRKNSLFPDLVTPSTVNLILLSRISLTFYDIS